MKCNCRARKIIDLTYSESYCLGGPAQSYEGRVKWEGEMCWPSHFFIGIFIFHLPPTLDMIRLAKENKRTSSTKNAINKSKIAQKWQIRAWSPQIFHFPCTFRSGVQITWKKQNTEFRAQVDTLKRQFVYKNVCCTWLQLPYRHTSYSLVQILNYNRNDYCRNHRWSDIEIY